MNVLLSIRPKYVEEIIKGNKRYEFRKSIFKKNVEEVWIYATSPTMDLCHISNKKNCWHIFS